MDGIINVYKEAGYTSHDVVAKLRGILQQRKIGHTGTLDPEAEGVLPICVGKATKVCELLTGEDKSYRAVCQLGVVTDTQDMSGTIQEKNAYTHITQEKIREVVDSFLGESMQVPPMYSALKVNGKKLYELAREGKTVERAPRKIVLKEIRIVDFSLQEGRFTMDITCSKGTYIRTICHDIGQKLGVGAAMASLLRTRVSIFTAEKAQTLEQIEKRAQQGDIGFLIPVDALFGNLPAMQIVNEEGAKRLANGNPLTVTSMVLLHKHKAETEKNDAVASVTPGKVLVYDREGNFKGIYEKKGSLYRVVKMF